jgi:hypothetical protein
VEVPDGNRTVVLWPSALSDGLGNPVQAVAALVLSPAKARTTIRWMDEPGEYRWLLVRDEATVRVRIVRFRETFSGQSDEAGEAIFETDARLAGIAGQVTSQFERVRGRGAQSARAIDGAAGCASNPTGPVDAATGIGPAALPRERAVR